MAESCETPQQIKVLTLNCWAIPQGIPTLSSPHLKQRVAAIADFIISQQYSVIFLQVWTYPHVKFIKVTMTTQEIWDEEDYEFLKEKLSKQYPYSSYFQSGLVGAGTVIFTAFSIRVSLHNQCLTNISPTPVLRASITTCSVSMAGLTRCGGGTAWPGLGWAASRSRSPGRGGGTSASRSGSPTSTLSTPQTMWDFEYPHTGECYHLWQFLADRVCQALEVCEAVRWRLLTSDTDLVIIGGDLNTQPTELPHEVSHMMTSSMFYCSKYYRYPDHFLHVHRQLEGNFGEYCTKSKSWSQRRTTSWNSETMIWRSETSKIHLLGMVAIWRPWIIFFRGVIQYSVVCLLITLYSTCSGPAVIDAASGLWRRGSRFPPWSPPPSPSATATTRRWRPLSLWTSTQMTRENNLCHLN